MQYSSDNTTKHYSSVYFTMLHHTDLSKLHWMLGIQVSHNCNTHTTSILQHTYIDSILCHYNFVDVKPLSTPINPQVHLTSEQAPLTTAKFVVMCDVPYRKAISALNWAALTTHPDIVCCHNCGTLWCKPQACTLGGHQVDLPLLGQHM